MRCFDVEENMVDFVFGTVSDPARAEMRYHMAHCSSCRTWHDDVVASMGHLKSIDHHSNIDVVERVRVALETKGGVSRKISWRHTTFAHYAIAASLTIAVFAIGGFEGVGWHLLSWTGAFSSVIQGL